MITVDNWFIFVCGCFCLGYFTAKSIGFLLDALFVFGWRKTQFKWSKSKKDNALKAMCEAFDCSPKTVGECKAFGLNNGYYLLFIKKERCDAILKDTDNDSSKTV